MPTEKVRLANGSIAVTISSKGAEPQSIIDDRGAEYLWQAGPAWRRHAPILFPAICRVSADDLLRASGIEYPMPQHGFARDLEFAVVDVSGNHAVYVLTSNSRTRDHFPFEFALAVTYTIDGAKLVTSYVVENTGDVSMPFSLGSHPAFAWHQRPDAPDDTVRIAFAEPEPAPYRRVVDNLLSPVEHPSLASTGTMPVSRGLFDEGAVIMPNVNSRSLRFDTRSGREIRLAWNGFTGVTTWTKSGAEFLCVEVWRGEPAPEGFAGEWADKPANTVIGPGERAKFSYSIELL